MIRFWTSRKGMAEIVGAALLILFLAIQIMPAVKNVSINSDKLIAAVDAKIKGQLTSGNNYSIPVHGTDFILMEDTQADWQAGTLTNVLANGTGDLVLQTVAPPTFARNSIAYKSDGTQVATNEPRFETGKFGQAMMIEDGTTNYIVSPTVQTELISPTSSYDQETYNHRHPYGGVAQSVAVTYSLSFDLYQRGTKAFSSIVVGGVVGRDAWGARLWSDGTGANLTFVTLIKTDLGNGWVRWKYTFTVPTTSYLQTFVKFIAESWDYPNVNSSIRNVQLEQKPYATSFIDSTRASELVSIALADIINTKEGTIEFWLKPLNLEKNMYVGVGGSRFISATEDNVSYNIWFDSSDGGLHTSYGYGTGLYSTGSYNGLQTGNWYYIATTWKENDSIKLYVNGTLHSSAPIGTLGTSSVFKYQTLFLGQSSLGEFFANALFDELRISNKARNADEISSAYSVGSALSIDEYTTYKCSFDGTLLAGRGGMRISPVYDISQVKIASDSSISWTATTPTGTGIVIESNLSLDGGSTWLGWKQCTNGGQIPDITSGIDLSNARLQIREKLTTSDVTVTPSLDSLTINITAQ